MMKISSGLRLAICVLSIFSFSVRSVKGQTESYALSGLPDNPAAKDLAVDKKQPNVPARESPKVTATTTLNVGPHKLTVTTKLWVASSLAVYTAAALDMHATEKSVQRVNALHKRYPWFPVDYSFESNPLARPLLKLPAPAYYACGIALATGVNWVGLRMAQSKRFRRVWWLPQALSAAGNTHGYLSYQ